MVALSSYNLQWFIEVQSDARKIKNIENQSVIMDPKALALGK